LGSWKYIAGNGDGGIPGKLYDSSIDPSEDKDLANTNSEKLQLMHKKLDEILSTAE